MPASISQCYFASNSRVMSLPILKSVWKDDLPLSKTNVIIYYFKSQCDNDFTGRTTELHEITQHASAFIRRIYLRNNKSPGSAIAEHLIEKKEFCVPRRTIRTCFPCYTDFIPSSMLKSLKQFSFILDRIPCVNKEGLIGLNVIYL